MHSNQKYFLLILCLLCCALLTGCYTDIDPWPSADNLNPATAVPTSTPTPVSTSAPTETPQPATQAPPPEDAVDVSPNFNG